MWQTIKRALQLLGKEAGWLVLAGGLAIAAAALGLQLPPLLSELWQSYSETGEVLLPLLKVAAVVAGQFILKYASNLLMSANVEVAAARLREALFAAMMEEDVAFFDSVHSAQLVNLLSVDVKELRDTLRSLLTEGLSYVATAAGGVASLFASSSKLSAALTSVVPFGLLVAHAYAARLRRLSRASQEAQAQTASIAAEALANIRTVKCFTAEELERQRYHDALATSSAASLRISSEIGLFHGLMGLGLSALAGGVFLYGGHLVSAGEMAQPQLLAFIMQTQGLTRSLEGLSIQHTRLLQAKGSFDRINAVLDAANERRARYRARHCARWEGFKGDLKLSGVTFAYPTRPTAVILKDVSIDIPAGKVVALAGPSGSGKSTVAALLLGYYQLPELQGDHGSSPAGGATNGTGASSAAARHEAAAAPSSTGGPSAGADHAHASADATASAFVAPPQASRASRGLVTVDARPLPYVDMQWYREHVAFVPQDAAIFSTTVRANIGYGKPGCSDAEIEAAARAANAWDFIQRLPQGLDTPVGERACSLSGGQRQRIALARALVRDPKILILDEYSSALDAETEAVVQDALAQKFSGRTVVIIAHRLSTIAASDVIYVMSAGSVVESGSHAELCSRPSGIYASLVRRQQQLSSAGGPSQPAAAAGSAAARRPGSLASRLPPAARQPPVDAEAGFEAVMAERVAGPSRKGSAAA